MHSVKGTRWEFKYNYLNFQLYFFPFYCGCPGYIVHFYLNNKNYRKIICLQTNNSTPRQQY